MAVGNGEDEAILLLDFNKDKKSEDRIIKTIKAVSNRNIYVGSDVVIKDTLDSTKTKFIK